MRKEDNFIFLVFILLIFFMFFLKLFNVDLFIIYNNLFNYFCIILVILVSIYFTFKLKFIQFNIVSLFKNVFNGSSNDIKALFMSLGSKIGVGSIVGISLSVYVFGIGIIFWVWVITFLSSVLTYCESYLGRVYKNGDNGGAFYYIRYGAYNKYLSYLYVFLLFFIYAVGYVSIQSNAIFYSILDVTYVNNYVLIVLILIVISSIIFNSLGNIINFISKIVPLMCVLYIVFCLFIIFKIDNLNDIFCLIFRDAFRNDKSIIDIIVVGFQRGIFANEAGIGTSSITTGISDSSAFRQGIFQIVGVYFISFVIITLTGIVVYSKFYEYVGRVSGSNIIMYVFNSYYGFFGRVILSIIIIMFALSTIISVYFFIVKGIVFLCGNLNFWYCFFIKLFIILFVFMGMIVKSSFIWFIIDILVLFLLLLNVYVIFKLRKEIK